MRHSTPARPPPMNLETLGYKDVYLGSTTVKVPGHVCPKCYGQERCGVVYGDLAPVGSWGAGSDFSPQTKLPFSPSAFESVPVVQFPTLLTIRVVKFPTPGYAPQMSDEPASVELVLLSPFNSARGCVHPIEISSQRGTRNERSPFGGILGLLCLTTRQPSMFTTLTAPPA
jgi:hypothetical protein